MSEEDRPTQTTADFSPQELALILAEIEGMRADLRADRESAPAPGLAVASAEIEIGLDDDIEAWVAICNAGGPAAILADHERRIRALERTLGR
jgi:hypothetical protein